MPTESICVPERCWCSSVAEQMHKFMDAFLIFVVEARHGQLGLYLTGGVLTPRTRTSVSSLSDSKREKHGLPNQHTESILAIERAYSAVEHLVLILFRSIDLDTPSSRIPNCVCGALLGANS